MQYLTRITCILFSIIIFKTNAEGQNHVVIGKVLDSLINTPVEFASISVLNTSDSSIQNGTLTNTDGSFKVSVNRNANYIIKVIALGYETKYIQLKLTGRQNESSIENIYLIPASSILNEVVVKDQKKSISNQIDKQTYKANQFEAARGGTATDILKNLPSINLNSAGEISVRGSTGFLVLINGKPIVTDAATFLSQLPANTIESIELITAPSAKYDADGKGGIINITTKKGSTDGWALQFNLLAGLPSTTNYDNLENPIRAGADMTVNYKKSKWDLTISANYNRNDANGQRDGDVFTVNSNANYITRFPSFGERSFDRYNYGIRSNVGFSPNKKNQFNIGFFTSKKFQQRRADIVYKNVVEDFGTGQILRRFTYFNSNVQEKEGKFLLGSIDYTFTFKEHSSITATAIYEKANLYGNTINNNLDFPNKANSFQLVTNPYTNPISGYRLKLDYASKIGKGKLESGIQFRGDQQNGNFGYTVTPTINQSDSSKFRGQAESKNQINGLYTQYSNKISKLQYTFGIRYEYAFREVKLSSDINPHILQLNNLFPSANFLYKLNNNWSSKFGYSKRVQRNNNFELNPIPEREHSETLEQGDPDLLPQFIDLVELGINYTFPKGSVFATSYFQSIKNPIQRVNSVYADTILNRLFTNAGRAQLFGFELGSNIQANSWLNIYLGGNIYHYSIQGNLNVLGELSTIENSNWVYSINFNSNINLGHNWSMQANLNYLSNRPTAQGEDSRFFSPNTSVKKILKNGKYTFSLQWQHINLGGLRSNQQRISTWGRDFYTTTNYVYETDVLLLNFNINLNKLNNKKLPTSEIGEKEF